MLGGAGRLVEAVSATANTIQLADHGFETDDAVTFRAIEGGSLPAPLVEATTYYAIRVTSSLFRVAAAAAGSAIDLTTAGAGAAVATEPPFDDVIEFYSRFVDGFIPHAAPLTLPVPVIVKAIVAELAAKKLLALAGQTSAAVNEAELAAKAQLERWSAGVPIRDANVTASSNKSVSSAYAASSSDPRGWGTTTLP